MLKYRRQKIRLENHLISLKNNNFLKTISYTYHVHSTPRIRYLHWKGLASTRWLKYEVFIDINEKNSIKVQAHLPDANTFILKNNCSIPHIYNYDKNTELAQLCLFYPKKHEFTRYDLAGETIGYWIIEWLNYYEYWTATGTWYGGGHCIEVK